MPTVAELTAKWTQRLADAQQLHTLAPLERVAAEIVDDLRQLGEDDLVSLQEASRLGGYSVDHLQRLVRAGKLVQRGRRHAPRIRRSDVPVKPGHQPAPLRPPDPADHFSRRRRIVADAQHGGT
jgi:hypothetical protein